MNEGAVVLVPFQQADGTHKNRPAIVLRALPPFNDLLPCGVSMQLRHEARGFDDRIAEIDTDFAASGLTTASLIRLGYLALLPAREVRGAIGAISRERHHRLLRRLSDYLQAPTRS